MEGVHHQHEDFVNSQWVEIGNLQQHGQQSMHTSQQPHDFGSYGFVESSGFVPSESQFRLQPAPVPIAPNYLGIPQWGQAMMPPTTSNPQFMAAPATAPPSISSVPSLPAAVTTHTTQSTSSPRRTLTDADRRRMCLFHEENPNVKQTEIGGTSHKNAPFLFIMIIIFPFFLSRNFPFIHCFMSA